MLPALIIGATVAGGGGSFKNRFQAPTFQELIVHYMNGAHLDDVEKEIVEIKHKFLKKNIKKFEKKNDIYVPKEIVKLIANFSALELTKQKKLNELRRFVIRRIWRKISFIVGRGFDEYFKKGFFRYLLRHIGTTDTLERKLKFEQEVNILMLYFFNYFKRLFTFKRENQREINLFSKFYKDPLSRMKVLEKRRWCFSKNDTLFLQNKYFCKLCRNPDCFRCMSIRNLL